MMKILSIIVPVYNAEKYLSDCVQSLLEQNLSPDDYEILLINDGSTDHSLQIAESLEKQYSQVRVISQENKGVSFARNNGLAVAKGKYILFVDSDDYIEPYTIHHVISKAEENKLELCFFRVRVEYEDGSVDFRGDWSFKHNTIYTGNYIVSHGMNISAIWYTLYLSSKLTELNIRFSVGIVQEDVEFCMKLYPMCNRIMFIDEIVYHYRYYGSSLTRDLTISQIQRRYMSDLHVAEHIFDYIHSENLDEAVREVYARKMNSMLVANLLRLCISRRMHQNGFLRQYVMVSKQKGLYLVGHKTLSWRTFLLSYVVNTKLFEIILLM